MADGTRLRQPLPDLCVLTDAKGLLRLSASQHAAGLPRRMQGKVSRSRRSLLCRLRDMALARGRLEI